MKAFKNGGIICVLVVLLAGVLLVEGVDRGKFKQCKDSGFCRRNRDRNFTSTTDPFSSNTVGESVLTTKKLLSIPVNEPLGGLHPILGGTTRKLTAQIRAYENDIIRLSVIEESREIDDGLSPRYRPDNLVIEPDLKEMDLEIFEDGFGNTVVSGSDFDSNTKLYIAKKNNPFSFNLKVNNDVVISAGKLLFENHIKKPEEPKENPQQPPKAEEEKQEEEPQKHEEMPEMHHENEEEGWAGEKGIANDQPPPPPPSHPSLIDGGWDEYFGGSSDSKPNGPGAVGMDIWFPKAEMLYGIPEHASSVALKNTRGEGEGSYKDPYRLYNLDVFEYELNEPMALYGSIPLILAHSANSEITVGVLWLNPSETWIDINGSAINSPQTQTRWTSEDGIVDIWLLPGPTPRKVFEQYAKITGKMPLPPKFSIAYHQCRWNYRDEADVNEVDSQFDSTDFPYDVIWLDIEHTDGKRYFTWDTTKFPNPEQMQASLNSKGRKLVTIVDPHIKRDENYHVHKQANSRNLYVKGFNNDNSYEGSCWPGSSSWVDFLNADARAWWASLFALDSYRGSTDSLYTWNDMNEPSVFSGPEVTMQKDARHINKIEHRAVHNLYGLLNTMATQSGQLQRSKNQRPFVLTRAVFAGSQKYAAIWTGDNQAKWEYLRDSIPMILSLGIGGMPFAGADVGGFFGNPDTELLIRWYQTGAWYPFFRAHAHIETKRREPWLFDNKTTTLLRDAVRLRYSLLPYWYTCFYETSKTGIPIARTLWTEFPHDSKVLAIDEEFLIGSSILIHPITSAGQVNTKIYLPNGIWYDYNSFERIRGPTELTISTPIEKGIPIFIRGGSIIPRQDRARRSSSQMIYDPYTLFIGLDNINHAHGELYLDDGNTFDYKNNGKFSLIEFDYSPDNVLSSNVKSNEYKFGSEIGIEKIIITGIQQMTPGHVFVDPKNEISFGWNPTTKTIIIKKPISNILSSWKLTITP